MVINTALNAFIDLHSFDNELFFIKSIEALAQRIAVSYHARILHVLRPDVARYLIILQKPRIQIPIIMRMNTAALS